MRLSVRTVLAAVLLFSVACAGKQVWVGQAVSGPVAIQPQKAWLDGGKLWVHTIIVNNTGQAITITRDNIIARLPNGTTVQRASSTSHEPYFLAAGAAHDVNVEFVGDFANVPNAMIDFAPGITLNGQPMQVSPLVVSAAK
jgi:hypothetical protein